MGEPEKIVRLSFSECVTAFLCSLFLSCTVCNGWERYTPTKPDTGPSLTFLLVLSNTYKFLGYLCIYLSVYLQKILQLTIRLDQ